jgi:hypothetical protein
MDLLLNRMVVYIYTLMLTAYLVWLCTAVGSPTLYMIAACVMVGMVPMSIVAREDKFKASALSCSLPVTRLQVVRTRYVSSWLFMLAGLAWALLPVVLIPGSKLSVGQILHADRLSVAAVMLTLLMAGLMPFILRFGMLGLMIFLVAAQLLGLVSFLVGALAAGGSGVRGLIVAVIRNVSALRDGLGSPGFYLLVLGVALLLNYLSYRISVAVFRRRDL